MIEVESKSQFRRVTSQLVAKLDEAEALAASRLELLRRANRYLAHQDDCALRYNDQVCDCRLSKLRLEIAEELAQDQADEYIESESAHIILEVGDD